MNDELLNIKLTESEVNMIMDALNGAIMPTPESQDLMHDLFEQVARHGNSLVILCCFKRSFDTEGRRCNRGRDPDARVSTFSVSV